VTELTSGANNNRNIKILSNTPDLQVVNNSKLEICQCAFYKAGELEISSGFKIKMDSQGMAMLKMQGNKIDELTISDPSRKLNRITITVPGIYNKNGNNFIALPNNNQNNTLFLVDLPQGVFAGKSVTIKL
jgi:chondroitin AC lyase